MKTFVKWLLSKLPGGPACLEILKKYREYYVLSRFQNKTELFTHYYHHNAWGNAESVSGAGSTLEYTENIRMEIPRLLESFEVKSILDAPCGDFNWFRFVQRTYGFTYLGGDIVPALVAENNRRFQDAQTNFIELDITTDPIPDVDLWLCRDCLFHLSFADIHRSLDNFKKSNVRFFLTSLHSECQQNTDILAGDFRPLNLQLAPFGLCPPKLMIKDWVSGFPVRYLALWERAMLE